MTFPSIYSISKTLLSLLFATCLVFVRPSIVLAQEYTEDEYKAFQEIQAEKDDAKKTALIVKFLKEKPKTALRKNVTAEFDRVLADLEAAKRWTQMISLGEKFVDVAPEDSYTVMTLARAYAETKNSKGFAEFGEKAYAQKPSGQLAYAIAKAYLDLGNDAKFLQWGEKAAAAMPESHEILFELTRKYGATQNAATAAKYARMCLKALKAAKKPEGTSEQNWKNYTDGAYAVCYAAIGSVAYEGKNYAEAIANLDNSVKYIKRNDLAYYYLGMSYWQQNKVDAAMLNLAKAYVLKGSTSPAAKRYLDQLYRSGHRQSLDGQDRIIARAEQDLK